MTLKTALTILVALAAGLASGTLLSQNINSPSVQEAFSAVPNSSDFLSLRPAVIALPEEKLSAQELADLLYMREEEKLARDVYSVLYDTWGLAIFANIAQSEQTHAESVRVVLDKYGVTDPVADDTVGMFTNAELSTLFSELTQRGGESLEEALTVGALIEDLDIADLERAIAATDNSDIQLVYENLMRGSRNHLRAFISQLTTRGSSYTPAYISQETYNAIIRTERETGAQNNSRRGWGAQ